MKQELLKLTKKIRLDRLEEAIAMIRTATELIDDAVSNLDCRRIWEEQNKFGLEQIIDNNNYSITTLIDLINNEI